MLREGWGAAQRRTAPPLYTASHRASSPRWREGIGQGLVAAYWTFEEAGVVVGLIGLRTDQPNKYSAQFLGRLRRLPSPSGPFTTLGQAQTAIEIGWLQNTATAQVLNSERY